MPINFRSGWRPSPPDARDKLFKFRAAPGVLAALPAAASVAAGVAAPFNPALAQLDIGSCGPNTLDKNLIWDAIQTLGSSPGYSRLFLYYNTRVLMDTVNEDSGVDNRTMLKALAQYGYCDETLCPYDTSRFTQRPPAAAYQQALPRRSGLVYQAVDQQLAVMKACLVQTKKPFLFGFTVYDSMLSDAVAKTGVVPMPRAGDTVQGGHDVLFTGYNDGASVWQGIPPGYFEFQNHWNDPARGFVWGRAGYGYMPQRYAADPDLAGDYWVVTQLGGASPAPPPPPPAPAPTPTPGSVLAEVDAVFARLEQQFAAFPAFVKALRWANQQVDALLLPAASAQRAVGPGQVQHVIDAALAALETAFAADPVAVYALQLVQNLVDWYLTRG